MPSQCVSAGQTQALASWFGTNGASQLVTFVTLTWTTPEQALFPATSDAQTSKAWEPLSRVVVSRVVVYTLTGTSVKALPRSEPSIFSLTPLMPTLSVTLALTLTVRQMLAPSAGAVMVTLGGVVSGADEPLHPRLASMRKSAPRVTPRRAREPDPVRDLTGDRSRLERATAALTHRVTQSTNWFTVVPPCPRTSPLDDAVPL